MTCWQSAAGSAASEANARTAAWRFDISSAADALADDVGDREARRVSLKRIASKQSPPTPDAGCHDGGQLPAVDLRDLLRQQPLLDLQCFGELTPLGGVAARRVTARVDLVAQRGEQRGRCPTASARSRARRAHRLDGEIDAAPAGHDDHRQQPSIAARAPADRSLHGPTSCRRCS